MIRLNGSLKVINGFFITILMTFLHDVTLYNSIIKLFSLENQKNIALYCAVPSKQVLGTNNVYLIF